MVGQCFKCRSNAWPLSNEKSHTGLIRLPVAGSGLGALDKEEFSAEGNRSDAPDESAAIPATLNSGLNLDFKI